MAGRAHTGSRRSGWVSVAESTVCPTAATPLSSRAASDVENRTNCCGPLYQTGDPILTIDEPVARTSARIHVLPHISAAQHTDRNQATRCWLWRCEAWLLAVLTQTPQRHRPIGLARGTRSAGAVLCSDDDFGSSVERTATLHPLWQVLEALREAVQSHGKRGLGVVAVLMVRSAW